MDWLTPEMLCGTWDGAGLNRMSGNCCAKTGVVPGAGRKVQLPVELAKKLPVTGVIATGWSRRTQLMLDVFELRLFAPGEVTTAWATSFPALAPV